jgi:hypothetical protein
VGFVVDKRASGQIFSEYLRSPLPSIPPVVPHSSSLTGADTIGQRVASVIMDSVPLHPKKQKKKRPIPICLILIKL